MAESQNNRVLVYNLALGITNGMNASVVLGEPNFTTGAGGATQSTLSAPQGLALDIPDQNLFVADSSTNRILVFNVSTGTIVSGENASVVLGQPDFLHAGQNSIDGNALSQPTGVAVDRTVSPNRLYISDFKNNRVLGYKSIKTLGNGGAADILVS